MSKITITVSGKLSSNKDEVLFAITKALRKFFPTVYFDSPDLVQNLHSRFDEPELPDSLAESLELKVEDCIEYQVLREPDVQPIEFFFQELCKTLGHHISVSCKDDRNPLVKKSIRYTQRTIIPFMSHETPPRLSPGALLYIVRALHLYVMCAAPVKLAGNLHDLLRRNGIRSITEPTGHQIINMHDDELRASYPDFLCRSIVILAVVYIISTRYAYNGTSAMYLSLHACDIRHRDYPEAVEQVASKLPEYLEDTNAKYLVDRAEGMLAPEIALIYQDVRYALQSVSNMSKALDEVST